MKLIQKIVLGFVGGLIVVSVGQAAISTSGSVKPYTDPSTWTDSTSVDIGYSYDGALSITEGSSLTTYDSDIGNWTDCIGTVTVDGESSTWTNAYSLTVGTWGTGILNITNGGSVTDDYAWIANESGSIGTVTVDGEGSTWTNAGLYVGVRGTGTLSITNGGSVTNSSAIIGWFEGSSGFVSVDGEGSTWTNGGSLYVGEGGEGTLSIINGGSVTVDGWEMDLGKESGSTGTMIVDGEGSKLIHSGAFYVGQYGTGALSVTNGGAVTDQWVYLGWESGSLGTATVEGVNSTLNTEYDIRVGEAGTGTLNIANGGSVVTGQYGYIGYDEGATGAVTVDGEGSGWTVVDGLYVGYNGTGTLEITNGGSVTTEGWYQPTYIGYGSGSNGTVTVDGEGSTLTESYGLYVGYNGMGALNILNGATVSVDGATIVGELGNLAFGDDGGVLYTGSLYATSSQLSGTGRINTSGIVSDIDIQFDSDHGTAQTLSINDVTINLNQNYVGILGVGYFEKGSLSITDGVTVNSRAGYLGYGAGSTGIATVDGEGSTWNNRYGLMVGYDGTGVLNILNGATVSATSTKVGELGTINFGENGATLTTGSLFAGDSQLSGSGTINTSGIVGDLDLVFDDDHDSTQSFALEGISINLAQSASHAIGAGYLGQGSLAISDGVTVASSAGYLGYYSDAVGTATVDGAGSIWDISSNLYVGYEGEGALSITNGGSVTSSYGYLGYESGSNGTVNIDGEGSEWDNNSYFLYVGYKGDGNLNITNGATVTNRYYARIGNESGSTGTATVDGEGSTWTSGSGLSIGVSGTGSLNITNGGSVTNSFALIGSSNGSIGTVSVDGQGSTWASSNLIVGNSGTGTLSIANGGTVTATAVSINSSSSVTVDTGVGSSLKVGTADTDWVGTITNNGTINLVAGIDVATGTYTPISYGTMSGSGSVQAIGGVWDSSEHTVTVAEAVSADGDGGASATIDLSSTQRIQINDTSTGKSAGVSFLGTDESTLITLTATSVSDDDLDSLQSLLSGTDEEILSAWNFSTEEYTVSEDTPVHLSLDAYSADDFLSLTIWHLVNGGWTEYDASDLTFDGTYANFTASSFSGYAVTASTVPVPEAVWLFASGLLGMAVFRKLKEVRGWA